MLSSNNKKSDKINNNNNNNNNKNNNNLYFPSGVGMVTIVSVSTVFLWSRGIRQCRRGETRPSSTSPFTAISESSPVEWTGEEGGETSVRRGRRGERGRKGGRRKVRGGVYGEDERKGGREEESEGRRTWGRREGGKEGGGK